MKSLSNSYTSPICESRYRDKPIGIRVHDDERMIVTWIRTEMRPERFTARGTAGEPMAHYRIETDPDGSQVEHPISIDEYMHFTESVSQTIYEIRDRRVIEQIKQRGLAELDELEELNRRFQKAAEKYLRGRQVCIPHSKLNESYWT